MNTKHDNAFREYRASRKDAERTVFINKFNGGVAIANITRAIKLLKMMESDECHPSVKKGV